MLSAWIHVAPNSPRAPHRCTVLAFTLHPQTGGAQVDVLVGVHGSELTNAPFHALLPTANTRP